ncbi:Prephenate dehydratase [Pirellulimonas nuda]|uniref:Bifunctional chorismate mutase/prephenate dehydratase n=1 Tax=Pirellulimonas nuda TaxID=2528009 RepID=A0A518DGV9_9BACT|nr:prephenate dehydratase [Pirellulimonas nuda]QDU90672.1 Prephenate dehydratase [Pirellulimonas nuda]
MAKKSRPDEEAAPPDVRRQVAELDRQIAAAVGRRAELTRQAAADGGGVLERLEAKSLQDAAKLAGGLGAERIVAVFREVNAACRPSSPQCRIAYLGPEDTFSHIAAIHRFGAAADLTPVATIAAVFQEVESGAAGYGVVPMENSTDGRVSDTLECFSRSPVRICGELPLRVHHCLLGTGKRADVRRVFSKPQALSQCRNWLAQHLPQAQGQPVASTAEAAAMAAKDPAAAAIASRQAGQRLGLRLLAEDIEDQKDNITRFAIIAPRPAEKTGADKTALMFETPHEPGALADAMAVFKRKGLNLTWIESFPVPGSRGRYLFFVELVGHQAEVRVRRAVEALQKKALMLEVLGSYAHAEPIG